MRRTSLLVAFLLLLAGGAFPAKKQDPRAEVAQFFGNVDVSIFNLEVFATDADGQPVTDLVLEDFELFVDGKPTPILNFYDGNRARSFETLEPDEPPPATIPIRRFHRPKVNGSTLSFLSTTPASGLQTATG